MRSFLLLLLSTLSAAASSPPPGALVVGNGGPYKTVQEAVNAASPGKTIFIKAGTYNEQVTIEGANKKNIILMGETGNSGSYAGNKVTIVQSRAQDSPKGTNNDHTATLRALADGLKVYNINLENKRGAGSQALALSAYGDELGFYACQFKGFQDTVMTEKGRHVFAKSMIAGATDFIFGMHGQAWFEDCDIKTVNTKLGWITANGRDKADNPSFYVFNNCDVSGSAPAGSFYLGRPWREYSRVVFQNSKLSAVVNGAGWSEWQKSEPRTSKVYWAEHKNTGPGAGGSRKFGKKLDKAVPVNEILGGGHEKWVDMKYMKGN